MPALWPKNEADALRQVDAAQAAAEAAISRTTNAEPWLRPTVMGLRQ